MKIGYSHLLVFLGLFFFSAFFELIVQIKILFFLRNHLVGGRKKHWKLYFFYGGQPPPFSVLFRTSECIHLFDQTGQKRYPRLKKLHNLAFAFWVITLFVLLLLALLPWEWRVFSKLREAELRTSFNSLLFKSISCMLNRKNRSKFFLVLLITFCCSVGPYMIVEGRRAIQKRECWWGGTEVVYQVTGENAILCGYFWIFIGVCILLLGVLILVNLKKYFSRIERSIRE